MSRTGGSAPRATSRMARAVAKDVPPDAVDVHRTSPPVPSTGSTKQRRRSQSVQSPFQVRPARSSRRGL
ncbi:hypothetical protein [Streptosporangium sp. NPDC002524]|uniref:hypothetical protein n=1 Tax=Streptosporangium sp. NPDC002524 TaxID=3154537 RepID=UPI003334359D